MRCVECGAVADADAFRWRAYRVDADTASGDDELVFYCPECAGREFDSNEDVLPA